MRDVTVALGDSLVDNVTDGLAAWADGTKNFKEAFSDMTKSILKDIQRIAIRMAITRILGAAIGGATVTPTGDAAPIRVPTFDDTLNTGFGNLPSLSSLELRGNARGGIATEASIFGEGKTAEAAVPLPGNRHIPVDIRGGSLGGGPTYVINVQATNLESFDKEVLSALVRERLSVGHIVGQTANDNPDVGALLGVGR
jgi:hypothetical protein